MEKQNHLELFIDQAALALQNTWFLHRYWAVADIGQQINQDLETPEKLFSWLHKKIAEILDTSDAFTLAVYQPQTNFLDMHISDKGRYISDPASPVEGFSELVLKEQKPLLVYNLEKDSLPIPPVNIPNTSPTRSVILVPLVLRDVPLGVLSVQHQQPYIYDVEDQRILELVGNHVAVALSNMRLFDNLRLLNETGHSLIRELDAEQIFQKVVDWIRTTTKADTVILFRYSHEEEKFNPLPPLISGNLRDPSFPQPTYIRPNDIAMMTLQQPGPIYVKDSSRLYVDYLVNSDTERQSNFVQREKISSTAAMTLRIADEPVGVLFVNFRLPQRFDAPQKQLIEGLASYAAMTVKAAREFGARSQQERRRLSLLREIDRKISQTLGLQETLDGILQSVTKYVEVDGAAIFLYNPSNNTLRVEATHGLHKKASGEVMPVDKEKGIVRWVYKENTPILVEDMRDNPRWREMQVSLTDEETRSELDIPIFDGDKVIGVLNCESIRARAFSKEELDLLSTVAGQVVVAIKNAQAYEQVKLAQNRFKLLLEAGKELSEIADSTQCNQAYDIVLKIASTHNQSQAVIRRYHADSQELELVRALPHEHSLFLHIKLDEGLNGQVARERKTIVVQNVNEPPQGVNVKPSSSSVQSLVVTPIQFKEEYYGNLALSHETINHFLYSDVELIEGLAQQLAITLHRLDTVVAAQEANQRTREASLMSSIGQSAFELAHRLGNDLGLISGLYVNNISRGLKQQGVVDTSINENLDKINQDVRRVLKMVQELREVLAREREVQDSKVIMPVRLLLEEAMQTYPSPLQDIRVLINVTGDVAPVYIVHSQIADILRNLFVNAIEALPRGGTIILRARNVGRSVELQVLDTGIGIKPEEIHQIFNLFYSTKGSFGFGLWSARQNALKNGGDLRVQSELGQGTTFTLSLPKAE